MPHLYLDGTYDGGGNRNTWDIMIDNESGYSSPLVMGMHGVYHPDSSTGYVTVRIMAEDDPGLANLKLRVALTESEIEWQAPNGGIWHNQTLRDMIPGPSGQPIELARGDTVEYTFRFEIISPIVAGNCELVAFVQSNDNRRILQGCKISMGALWEGGPCIFTMGDANNDERFNGLDIVYSVNYLKGLGPAPGDSCYCGSWGPICVAADFNGNCQYNGIDISYGVNFLKGQGQPLRRCPDCAPEE